MFSATTLHRPAGGYQHLLGTFCIHLQSTLKIQVADTSKMVETTYQTTKFQPPGTYEICMVVG